MRLLYAIAAVFLTLFVIALVALWPQEKPVAIAISSWPGYTPLFYAKEKGWLETLPLKLYHVSSLNESIRLYKAGLCDGLATTNDVARRLQQRYDLRPVLFFDRSNGADKILSNRTLGELNASKERIDVFLEMESVNRLVFEGFLAHYRFDRARFRLHNISQDLMVDVAPQKRAALFISYEPFASLLIEQHYREIASSSLSAINIFDLLLVKTSSAETNRPLFRKLQQLLFRAIARLKSDPQEYYATVRHYLEGQTFERFMQSLKELELVETPADAERYRALYARQGAQP